MSLDEIVLALVSKFGMLDARSIVAALILLREELKMSEVPQPGRRLTMPQLAPVIDGLVNKGYLAVYQEIEGGEVKYVATQKGREVAEKIQIRGLDELAKKYQFEWVPLPFVVVLKYPQYW